MKKLTKKKRDMVRALIKRAINDLTTARAMTFKAYGSRDTTFDLDFAIRNLRSASKGINQMKLPREKATKDAIPPAADRPSNCPAQNKTCPMSPKSAIDEIVEKIVCEHLSISPDRCMPQASLVDDLGADELDPIEISMALECEFQISFTADEIEGATTYEKLLNLVKEKVAAKNNQVKEG